MKIALLANTTWYLFNFRLRMILTLQKSGHEIVVIGPLDDYVDKIEKRGIKHFPISISSSSLNPINDLNFMWQLHRILRNENIELLLSFTPKCNIYGSFVSKVTKCPIIVNISGLGRAFIRTSILTIFVRFLYKTSLKYANYIFFQNEDDMNYFINLGLLKNQNKNIERLPGSGVDIDKFKSIQRSERGSLPAEEPEDFYFILIARLLWDKGIGEYVEAARKVKQSYKNVHFQLLGFIDIDNPSAISQKKLDTWCQEGVVEYLGITDDVVSILSKVDCVVLPSYREGVPRSLLEAASMSLPIITTDTIGCRDVVDDGVTGLLCKIQDAEDLATKMDIILKMNKHDLVRMGQCGRQKMLVEFDESIVINKYKARIKLFEDNSSYIPE